MRMCQFTPRQPPADIKFKPQKYIPNPEVNLNHNDLYARAWEYHYEQPIFDAENNNAAPPNSQETPVQSDFSTQEMRNTPRITHECSPEVFPHTDEVSDVTDTYLHMKPDAESSSEQQGNSPTNPAVPNTTYFITQNLTAMTITDISLSAQQMSSTERARSRSRNSRNSPQGRYVAVHTFRIFYSGDSLASNSPATQSGLP